MSSKKPQFWTEFEHFLGDRYPKFLINILLNCGFDSKVSLLNINAEVVKQIEDYVNKNRYLLKNTVYEENEPFEFLIGHKVLITSIPENIKNFDAQKEKKKKEKKTINIDQDKLEIDLLTKLNNYAKSTKSNFTVSKESVVEFNKTDFGIKCRIICPLCSKAVACEHKNHWRVSNFTNHIRSNHKEIATHIENKNPSLNDTVPGESNNSTKSVLRIRNSDLDAILNVSFFSIGFNKDISMAKVTTFRSFFCRKNYRDSS